MKGILKPLIYRGVKTNYFINKNGDVYNADGYKLKKFLGKKGYVKTAININGKSKGIYVHVAVWESFMGPIPPKMEVNHIKAIKTDNRLSQLELVTKQGNMDHAKRLGLIPKGEECKMCKYKEVDIRKACELLEKKVPYKEIAETVGIPRYVVVSLANKQNWKHVVCDYDIHNLGKHRYTPEEDAKIINLFASGKSYEDIAKQMELTVKSVKCRLWHLGYTQGINHTFTKEEEAELMKLYYQGVSCDELAKKFGVTRSSIHHKVHRLKRKYKTCSTTIPSGVESSDSK